jgi:hypothetical protein
VILEEPDANRAGFILAQECDSAPLHQLRPVFLNALVLGGLARGRDDCLWLDRVEKVR